MAVVLVIDDDRMICNTLRRQIEKLGHEMIAAATLEAGLDELGCRRVDVVFLDVNLPDGSGLDALPKMTAGSPAPEVIIITGEGDPDGAELAIKNGAWAYIEKPFSMENMTLQLTRALQYHAEKTRPPTIITRDLIIGSDPLLDVCLAQVAQVAGSDINVLITGETGTGKELFARTIHLNSSRAHKNFVVVDCASLPESLVESILFGHEKGAFTGAEKARAGLIREADGGTLFLDEIGELPLSVQKGFLRVLQEYRFRPVGGSREVASNFRLLAATNRDLGRMVAAGRFRKDLLYRIRSFSLDLPPLRHRTRYIKALAIHFSIELCERMGIETKGFSPDFFETLTAYDWPGNVRELIRTMESVITVARFDPTLFPRHLPIDIRIHEARASVGSRENSPDSVLGRGASLPALRKVREAALARVEKEYLSALMQSARKDIQTACRISGLSPSRLYFLLKKYNLNRS